MEVVVTATQVSLHASWICTTALRESAIRDGQSADRLAVRPASTVATYMTCYVSSSNRVASPAVAPARHPRGFATASGLAR